MSELPEAEMKEPTPKDGEPVLACMHEFIEQRGYLYALNLVNGEACELEYGRPDGSTGKAKWARVCGLCHSSENPLGMIGDEYEWDSGKYSHISVSPPVRHFRKN
jgi:hypothetical protein